jgi:MYXO-CTERM domain-containing protein
MPSGVIGRPYDQALVVGGVPPYTTSVVEGSLPPGLAIDSSAHLAGVPASAGSFSFTLSVADSGSPQATIQGAMTVEVTELTGLEIALGRELQVFVNTDVSLDLTARGGVPPYAWGLAVGQLQGGLSLDPAGKIVGRVDKVSTATVTFAVTDSEGSRAEAEVFVRATVFRAGGGGGGGRGGRRGGCGCDARAERHDASPLILLVLGALVFVRRRV